FFFQAEDGIRDLIVTGVQTCALPISTPATVLEVMTGKIVPYVLIGLIQISIVLTLARLLFGVPIQGSLVMLYVAVLLFIAANLTDRKSTRLNSSHDQISYAVFCLKKK